LPESCEMLPPLTAATMIVTSTPRNAAPAASLGGLTPAPFA
jgi:hypothetical protein